MPQLKKVIKDSLYKETSETLCFFINFLHFSYTYFSNSPTEKVKFLEVAKYFVLYSKMEFLQHFGSLIENK